MSDFGLWAQLDGFGFEAMRTLLAVLWQSSILLAAAAVLAWMLRKRRASVRCGIWIGALLALPLLPLLAGVVSRAGAPQASVPVLPTYTGPRIVIVETPPLPTPRPDAAPEVEAPATADPTAMPEILSASYSETKKPFSLWDYPYALLLTAYALGCTIFLAWIALGQLRIRAWARNAMPIVDERAVSIFHAAAARLGLRGKFKLLESPNVPAALSFGALNPAVILPKGLAKGLSDDDLQALAIHELAHVKRRDPLIRTGVSLLRAVLFFHPLVWLAARQIELLAEHAADDTVLEATGEPISYAKLLARFAKQLPRYDIGTEVATGILFNKGTFLSRVEAILSHNRDKIKRLSRLALITTLLAAILSLGIVLAVPLGEKNPELSEEATATEDANRILDNLPPNLSDAVAKRFVDALEEQALPFIDQAQLNDISKELRDLVANTPQPNMTTERRTALLLAISPYVSDYFPTPKNAKERNQIYLEFPDRLKTFEWKLWLALQRKPIDQEAKNQLDEQIKWIEQHIASLPEKAPSYTHAKILARFDALRNDPLCPLFHKPLMTEPFEEFKKTLTGYPAKTELLHVHAHLVWAALSATHENGDDFALPFDDRVGQWGQAGGKLQLGFMSNRPFRSTQISFNDIKQPHSGVLDIDKGSFGLPDTAKHDEGFQRWLNEKGLGDFIYDEAKGNALVGVRGAKLAMLDVPDWIAADLVPTEKLRALINEKGQEIISLEKAASRYRTDPEAFYDSGGVYAAILTGDNQLAVIQITDFGPHSVGLRARKRMGKTPEIADPNAPPPTSQNIRQTFKDLQAAHPDLDFVLVDNTEGNNDTNKLPGETVQETIPGEDIVPVVETKDNTGSCGWHVLRSRPAAIRLIWVHKDEGRLSMQGGEKITEPMQTGKFDITLHLRRDRGLKQDDYSHFPEKSDTTASVQTISIGNQPVPGISFTCESLNHVDKLTGTTYLTLWHGEWKRDGETFRELSLIARLVPEGDLGDELLTGVIPKAPGERFAVGSCFRLGAPAHGIVVSRETGLPIPAATVQFLYYRSPEGSGLTHINGESLAISDEDGAFTIDRLGVPGAQYWVDVRATDFSSQIAGPVVAGQDIGRIELGPPVTISGEIHAPNERLSTAKFMGMDSAIISGYVDPTTSTEQQFAISSRPYHVTEQPQGDKLAFRFDNVRPGPFSIAEYRQGAKPNIIYKADMAESVEGLVINLDDNNTNKLPGEKENEVKPKPSLQEILEETSRWGIIRALQSWEWELSDAEAKLLRNFTKKNEGKDWHLRYMALRLLRKYDPDKYGISPAVEKAEELFVDMRGGKTTSDAYDKYVPEIVALGKDVLPTAVELLNYNENHDMWRKRVAIRVLAQIDDERVVPALREAIRQETNRNQLEQELLALLIQDESNAMVDEVADILTATNSSVPAGSPIRTSPRALPGGSSRPGGSNTGTTAPPGVPSSLHPVKPLSSFDQEYVIGFFSSSDISVRAKLRLYSHYSKFESYGQNSIIRGLVKLDNDPSFEQLTEIIRKNDANIRLAASEMRKLKNTDPCPLFAEVLRETSPNAAAESMIPELAERNYAQAIPLLKEMFESAGDDRNSEMIRIACAGALCRFGVEYDKYSPIVHSGLEGENWNVAYQIVQWVGDDETIRLLVSHLVPNELRQADYKASLAIKCLAQIGNPSSVPDLQRFMRGVSVGNWKKIGVAIEQIGSKNNLPAVIQEGKEIAQLCEQINRMQPRQQAYISRTPLEKEEDRHRWEAAVSYLKQNPDLLPLILAEAERDEGGIRMLEFSATPLLQMVESAWNDNLIPQLEHILQTSEAKVTHDGTPHYYVRERIAALLTRKTGKEYTYVDVDGTVRKPENVAPSVPPKTNSAPSAELENLRAEHPDLDFILVDNTEGNNDINKLMGKNAQPVTEEVEVGYSGPPVQYAVTVQYIAQTPELVKELSRPVKADDGMRFRSVADNFNLKSFFPAGTDFSKGLIAKGIFLAPEGQETHYPSYGETLEGFDGINISVTPLTTGKNAEYVTLQVKVSREISTPPDITTSEQIESTIRLPNNGGFVAFPIQGGKQPLILSVKPFVPTVSPSSTETDAEEASVFSRTTEPPREIMDVTAKLFAAAKVGDMAAAKACFAKTDHSTSMLAQDIRDVGQVMKLNPNISFRCVAAFWGDEKALAVTNSFSMPKKLPEERDHVLIIDLLRTPEKDTDKWMIGNFFDVSINTSYWDNIDSFLKANRSSHYWTDSTDAAGLACEKEVEETAAVLKRAKALEPLTEVPFGSPVKYHGSSWPAFQGEVDKLKSEIPDYPEEKPANPLIDWEVREIFLNTTTDSEMLAKFTPFTVHSLEEINELLKYTRSHGLRPFATHRWLDLGKRQLEVYQTQGSYIAGYEEEDGFWIPTVRPYTARGMYLDTQAHESNGTIVLDRLQYKRVATELQRCRALSAVQGNPIEVTVDEVVGSVSTASLDEQENVQLLPGQTLVLPIDAFAGRSFTNLRSILKDGEIGEYGPQPDPANPNIYPSRKTTRLLLVTANWLNQ